MRGVQKEERESSSTHSSLSMVELTSRPSAKVGKKKKRPLQKGQGKKKKKSEACSFVCEDDGMYPSALEILKIKLKLGRKWTTIRRNLANSVVFASARGQPCNA